MATGGRLAGLSRFCFFDPDPKKGADIRIEYNDGRVLDGKILLIAIANGCYCGGGVKGVPYCKLDDGLWMSA